MADIKQDLLQLQYSQNFDIQGMQEVNVDLELPPRPHFSGHGIRRSHRRHRPHCRCHRQTV